MCCKEGFKTGIEWWFHHTEIDLWVTLLTSGTRKVICRLYTWVMWMLWLMFAHSRKIFYLNDVWNEIVFIWDYFCFASSMHIASMQDMTSWHRHAFRITGPLQRWPSINSGFPPQRIGKAELWYFRCFSLKAVEQTVELPVIWDSVTHVTGLEQKASPICYLKRTLDNPSIFNNLRCIY